MKLFVANVGVNQHDAQKRGMKSPIFSNGRFEFIPIKEARNQTRYTSYTYQTLPCYNIPSQCLAVYLPENVRGYIPHNDPEFETYTYGDVYSPRASNLQHIHSGDLLFFLARLYPFHTTTQTFHGKSDFYFIGYFTVQEVVAMPEHHKKAQWVSQYQPLFSKNAHFIKYQHGATTPFRIIKGDENRSFRFLTAQKITVPIVELLYDGTYVAKQDLFISNKDGQIVKNKRNKKPKQLKYFHSTTRSIQAFLDSQVRTEKECIDKLLAIVHNSCSQ